MSFFFHNILLQGRNNDYEVIMNILFVVVMAVFWIVGTIVKSKIKNSDQDEQNKNKPQQKFEQKPTSIGKAFWEQFIELSQNTQSNQKRNIQTEKKIHPVKATVSEKTKSNARRIKERPKPVIPKPPENVSIETPLPTLTVPQQETIPSMTTGTTSEPVYSFGISFDELEPEEIKRAILYTEILGKPVSMREPS